MNNIAVISDIYMEYDRRVGADLKFQHQRKNKVTFYLTKIIYSF